MAYAERLARDGYDVVLVAPRRERLEEVAERLRRERGVQAEVLSADLTEAEALAQVEARLANDESIALLQ
jgi:short-subunit dehydrogenase